MDFMLHTIFQHHKPGAETSSSSRNALDFFPSPQFYVNNNTQGMHNYTETDYWSTFDMSQC